MKNNIINILNSKVDRVNVKSLTNFKKKYRNKKNSNKRIKLIHKLNYQSKYLLNNVIKIYLYLLLHEKMINNLFTKKSIDFNFLINVYLSKIDFINSIDSLLLTNISNYLYNHIQNKTNNNYTIDQNINLKNYNSNFFFKGIFINHFFINYKKIYLFNNKINNNNFFNSIFYYLYLSIRMRHTKLIFNLLIYKNGIMSNNIIYNTDNIYEKYYIFINNLKIYLYNKQNNKYNVTLKYNYLNLTPYQMFDTNYYITNTSIRKHFSYEISPLYICFLNTYIKKTRYWFIINIICLLYIWSICILYFNLLMDEEFIVFGNYKKEVIRYHLS